MITELLNSGRKYLIMSKEELLQELVDIKKQQLLIKAINSDSDLSRKSEMEAMVIMSIFLQEHGFIPDITDLAEKQIEENSLLSN
jgi:hypothetical protein